VPHNKPPRRSQRARRSAISNDYEVYVSEEIQMEGDPASFEEAMRSAHSFKCLDAMEDEMRSMSVNKVWDLEEISKGVKTVGCKWVYKMKCDSNGNIERFKARLVAKGFTQKEGIDYTEIFSPISCMDSLRIIMALVAHYDLELHQMDVKTAFLDGDLLENVYMAKPKGFAVKGKEHMGCQSAASSDVSLLLETKMFLSSNFDMKDLGEASFVLGIKIHRDRRKGVLGLSQKAYLEKILKKFSMHTCNPTPAPIVKGDKYGSFQIPRNQYEIDQMKSVPYASAVESLMYAQVCTRPDLAFVTGMLARCQKSPGISH
jgi:hypothetical protein